jgi:hypothetical protein
MDKNNIDVEEVTAIKLDSYVRFRAKTEGVGYDLSPEYFLAALRNGVRAFFGVEVENGELIDDIQQPELLEKWKKESN